jgi:peptidoglycan/LPS O-acetylase OafA/YrhL
VHLAWAAVLLVVVVVLLRRSRPRAVAVAGLLAVGVLVVPVALEARSISDVGYFWQGRYTLPLAVGVPLVLAAGSRASARRPLLALLLTVLAACHLVGYVVALGRYTVGTGNGLGLVDEQWAPPLPALVLATAFALTLVAGAVGLSRLGREPDR